MSSPKTAAPAKPRPSATRAPKQAARQAKLAVGPVNDRFEREADRVAERVVAAQSLPAAAPPPVISGLSVQRMAAPMPAGPEQTEEEAHAPEEPVQRATRGFGPEAARGPPPALKQEDDPREVATKLAQTEADPATPPGAAGGTAPAAVEASIERMRARPAPGLDPDTRALMEARIGTDFGAARVHTDRAANEAAGALGARAFTVGRDMFFAQGQFDPKSSAGQRLIAHELTHTIQQGGGSAAARRIQRAGDGKSASTVKPDEKPQEEVTTFESKKLKGAKIEASQTPGVITLPALQLPNVGGGLKGTEHGGNQPRADSGRMLPVEGKPFELKGVPERPPGQAYKAWTEYARTHWAKGLAGLLGGQLKGQADAAPISFGGEQVYYLKRKKAKAGEQRGKILIGTVTQLAESDGILRPKWSPTGTEQSLDADHILELQIGGLDDPSNMWLLDSTYNQRIGPAIKGALEKDINALLKEADAADTLPKAKRPGSTTEAKRSWTLKFNTVKAGSFGRASKNHWSKKQIKGGEHLAYVEALTTGELVELGFKFDPDKQPDFINVFTSKEGGEFRSFRVAKDKKSLIVPKVPFFKGVEIVSADYVPLTSADQGGVLSTLTATLTQFKTKGKGKKKKPILKRSIENFPLKVHHEPRLGFGGYVYRPSLSEALKGIEFGPLSPITFTDAAITDNGELSAIGMIGTSKLLLPQLQVPILLRGSDILVAFPVPTDKLKLGPVQVTEAALELGVGESGFFMQGSASIAVTNVGQGTLTARVTGDDVVLTGDFNLELTFLEPANVKVTYSVGDDTLAAEATLGVKKGTLPGVESGEVRVSVSREKFGVVGSLNLGGILAGSTITVGYTPETGLLIEGKDLPLPVDKLPGVSDAKVTVRARRNPETGAWLISGGGKAGLSVAGATGTLDILFDGEAVTFKGRADVAKGPASGSIDVTASNRSIDEEGNPIEGGPVGELKIWGKGEASIAFGKVLTGTAGLEYTPDGRVIVSGEIALPPNFKLFDRVPYDKTLLEVSPPDFWIWGVKLGPVGFGIFAFVDAKVSFNAYVGPGELRDTKVKATVDLDKPEDATVEGKALFFVPAFAGLTLDVGGGLKAQVAVAYVKGRVGLDGTLGLGLDGSFGVDVKWNRDEGLAASAEAKITARPKFEVGVNASVSAGVDLWLTEIEKTWGPWRKKLGEFGPNMELGVTFPIKWSEKDGLDLSLDNITVTKPKLDAKALMSDAFDTLV